MRRLAAAAAPGALYFAVCFAAGTVMGPIRVLALEPRLGRAAAVALEAPMMLLVSVLAARAVLRRWPEVSPLAVGAVGLGLLLVAEAALAVALDRPSPLALPRGLADGIGLALMVAFALIPACLARRL